MDYFGVLGSPKPQQLKEPLREGEEQLTSIEGNFSHPTKPGDSPEQGRDQGRTFHLSSQQGHVGVRTCSFQQGLSTGSDTEE